MSFSSDIRATKNFNRQFGKEKRRIQLSEIPKSDIDSMQQHVIEMRTYAHFLDVVNTTENIHDVPIGPNDYYFEPDYNTVKIRTLFRDVNGIGMNGSNNIFQTINGVNYYSAELFDQAASSSRLWYSVAQSVVGTSNNIFNTDKLWKWNVGFHPPQLEHGNSLSLNVGTNTKQMFYVSDLGSNFDFTAEEFTIGFWIYPTALPQPTDDEAQVAYRRIDSSNRWSIEIDEDDNKLYAIVRVAGVETKRQYDTPLTINNWYFITLSWDDTGPSLILKVNDNADTSSTKVSGTGTTTAGLYFGSWPGAGTSNDFKGYLTGMTYYNDTVLSSTEKTNLMNHNTKSVTTEPLVYGYGQYG